jgi:peroxiredoxin
MANALTGEFDVVVQVGVPTINRILAGQHQVTRPRAIHHHSIVVELPLRDAGVRGIAEVQISTPTITLPAEGDGSPVTAHFQIRANVMGVQERLVPAEGGAGPGPGDARGLDLLPGVISGPGLTVRRVPLPEVVHGEVRATVKVGQISAAAEDVITIDLNADDVDIAFTPASGATLSADHRELVDRLIDRFLRTGFQPVNWRVRLPDRESDAEIHHWRLKTMPTGGPPAVAILLNLRDVAPDPRHVASVDRVFLARDDHFAIAIGRDFLAHRIRDELLRLFGRFSPYVITVRRGPFRPCRYRIRLDEPRVELRDGRIWVTVSGDFTAGEFACPGYGFVVTEPFELTVDRDTLRLRSAADPSVSVSGFLSGILAGALRDFVGGLRGTTARGELQPMLDAMTTRFSDLWQQVGVPGLSTRLTSVEIIPDGVIVRGTLDTGPWHDVAATVHSNVEGVHVALSAFRSWIPGGAVHRYRFSWHVSGRHGEAVEDHAFVTRFAPFGGFLQPVRVCVEVEGTQAPQSGAPRAVIGRSCGILTPTPPWVETVRMRPGPSQSERLRLPVMVMAGDTPVAHMDPWGMAGGSVSAQDARSTNLVVHFAGSQSDTTISSLRDALAAHGKQETPTFVVAVLPPGLGSKNLPPGGPIAWAEDHEGGWSQALGARETPATYLIDPRGKIAWHHVGQLDANRLLAAFNEHLVTAGPVRWRQVRLRVREGDPAPDFLFEYLKGRRMALRTLRGQPALLSFWTSWSAPCLAELRRLQARHERRTKQSPVILAINDGEDPRRAREAFDRNGFTFSLVPDADRHVAQRFGVSCWPTTVSVDAQGLVRHIQLGAAPEEHLPALEQRNL